MITRGELLINPEIMIFTIYLFTQFRTCVSIIVQYICQHKRYFLPDQNITCSARHHFTFSAHHLNHLL